MVPALLALGLMVQPANHTVDTGQQWQAVELQDLRRGFPEVSLPTAESVETVPPVVGLVPMSAAAVRGVTTATQGNLRALGITALIGGKNLQARRHNPGRFANGDRPGPFSQLSG